MKHSWIAAAATIVTVAATVAVVIPAAASSTGRTVDVGTANEFRSALKDARPGDIIRLKDGVIKGVFTLSASGSSEAPITITGSRNAVLEGNGAGSGYGLHLDGANYTELRGFSVTSAQKGIVLDHTSHAIVDGLYVHNIGMEAIHLRANSSDNVVSNNLITDTGVTRPGFGEGIYLGTAQSNWSSISGGQPDASNSNKVLFNTVGPNVRGEAVDIKEGTSGGEVRGNVFDGTGESNVNYDDSWVDVKGNNYVIADNHGTHALLDGYQTHVIEAGYGAGNVFARNVSDVGAPGYGFRIQLVDGGAAGNVVCADNTVTGAGLGIANIALTSECPWSGPDDSSSTSATPRTSSSESVTVVTTPKVPTTDTAPPSSTNNPTGPQCAAPPWVSSSVYNGGDTVSWKGDLWSAQWWTTGAEPGTTGEWGVWLNRGPCAASATSGPTSTSTTASTSSSATKSTSTSHSTPTPSSTSTSTTSAAVTSGPTSLPGACPSEWSSGAVYVGGDRVSYSGVIYTARWWTLGENPATAGQWGAWAQGLACPSA